MCCIKKYSVEPKRKKNQQMSFIYSSERIFKYKLIEKPSTDKRGMKQSYHPRYKREMKYVNTVANRRKGHCHTYESFRMEQRGTQMK